MMRTELERLQNALKHQQRYLHCLGKTGTRVILGVGMTMCALFVVASHLFSSRGPFPGGLIGLIFVGILGELIVVVGLMGSIWLCRMLARAQIKGYQEAIETLEREQ